MIRGQKLFVRPIEQADWSRLELHFPGIEAAMDESSTGVIGKLLGEPVAYALLRLDAPQAVVIERIFVTELLRRKGVGTIMLQEIERLTAAGGRHQAIAVAPGCDASHFFESAGFSQTRGVLSKQITLLAKETRS